MVYALCSIGIPLGIALVSVVPSSQPPNWEQPVQVLWTTEQEVSCPENEPASAAALADKLRAQAESARERAPFSPEDGTQAVDLFASAAACYSAAGASAEVERAHRARADLKKAVEREFHVHQVRLERALVTQRFDQAKIEIRVLLSFANHRAPDYVNWLSTLDRQIVVKFTGET